MMVPRNAFLCMLLYVTLTVMGTTWLTLKYINDQRECACSKFKRDEVDLLPYELESRLEEQRLNANLDSVLEALHRNTRNVQHPVDKDTKILDADMPITDIPPSTLPQPPQDKTSWGSHQLALVVPFRNRFEELLEFVPHMTAYLNEKKVRHKIYIINQVDKHRFNRASLLNIGFLVSKNECDYIAMHDVDLLPVNPKLSYNYPEKGPFHVAAPFLHPKYHYKTFVGGILILTKNQFEEVNGLSNSFWGWGREDDELYLRMKKKGMTIYRPVGINTGYETFKHDHDSEKRPRDYRRLFNQTQIYRHTPDFITTGYDTFKHNHDAEVRKRDYARYYDQKKASFKQDVNTGVNDVKYKITKTYKMDVQGSPCTIVNVEVECDKTETPWCDVPKSKSKTKH